MDNLTETEKEFFKACENGNLEKVKTLIKQGVNINRQNFRSYNSTALMEACLYNQKEVVKELLKNGADLSRKNKQNKTALDIAREKGHTNLIGVLEKYRNL